MARGIGEPAGADGYTVLEPVDPSALEAAKQRTSTLLEAPLEASAKAFRPPQTDPEFVEESSRPQFRPDVPRLLVLDDGENSIGEVIRLRQATTVIGRTAGCVNIPHDQLISGKHAEIIREGTTAPCRWVLRDLGSSNGTFVNCSKSPLRPERLLILGSRRFQFCPPQAATETPGVQQGTVLVSTRLATSTGWPCLVDAGDPERIIRLSGSSLKVGRPGVGNDIEIDDPWLAKHHATISKRSNGDWWIEARPSRNGVWVQVQEIRLVAPCRFQCGEQKFLFLA
jgi:pSer/pThr/pTyr-binding forkhead associated (FHA) protein